MSTFNGKVAEFPDIRIDHFRPDPHSRPPLAYFLSHVHSDHLVGLESCKSPFIYCSPATRDILLRLEKYPHRMNFAKGILETRKQTYRHLKTLLKAIPLNTPTTIELAPGNEVRVTMFDANHCVGAVMFLIEGGGKAILYTGDIRSEKWWVDSLVRHPVLIPYVSVPGGQVLGTLDCIYIDTTFVVTGRDDPYRRFPSKAEGIRELLEKVSVYPDDTVFYVDAWTFGYEDVWQALSTFLGSQIHVDDYRYGLYRALANGVEPKAPEAISMMGFHCGNHFQQGCLSASHCRIHSCEKGTGCVVWEKDFVRITPIVSRYNGVEIAELGTGGGQGDLTQQHELEIWNPGVVGEFMALCATKLQGQTKLLKSVLNMITSAMKGGSGTLSLDDFTLVLAAEMQGTDEADLDEVPFDKLVSALAKLVTKANIKKGHTASDGRSVAVVGAQDCPGGLARQITFPYSRHASYEELCLLVEALKPRNIIPCTVDESNWSVASSMGSLFGHLYQDVYFFSHDQAMLKIHRPDVTTNKEQQRPASSDSDSSSYRTPYYVTEIKPSDAETSLGVDAQKLTDTSARPRILDAEPNFHKRTGPGERQMQGDFWPPLGIDHYSPTSNRTGARMEPRKRRRSLSHENGDDGQERMNRSELSKVRHASSSPLRGRQLRRIETSESGDMAQEEQPISMGGSHQIRRASRTHRDRRSNHTDPNDATKDVQEQPPVLKKCKRNPQLEDYGRLKPPSALLVKRSASESSHTPTPTKMAAREEARKAAQGINGHTWSSISLVSVTGHQIKEEEL